MVDLLGFHDLSECQTVYQHFTDEEPGSGQLEDMPRSQSYEVGSASIQTQSSEQPDVVIAPYSLDDELGRSLSSVRFTVLSPHLAVPGTYEHSIEKTIKSLPFIEDLPCIDPVLSALKGNPLPNTIINSILQREKLRP